MMNDSRLSSVKLSGGSKGAIMLPLRIESVSQSVTTEEESRWWIGLWCLQPVAFIVKFLKILVNDSSI